MARSVAFCLAVLLALFEVGSCIQCFQCNTQSDPSCANPIVGKTRLVDCAISQDFLKYNQDNLYNILPNEVFGSIPGAPRFCHKIVMETGTVIRTCLDANPSHGRQTCDILRQNSQTATADKKIKSCDVCEKDKCNGAASLTHSLPLALLALVVSYLAFKQ